MLRSSLFLWLCLMVVGCGSAEPLAPYPPARIEIPDGGFQEPAEEPTTIVTFWVQPHEFIPFEGILDGCDYWNDVGVYFAPKRASLARITIQIDEGPCTVENGLVDAETGNRILGVAWFNEGRIIYYAQCMFHMNTNYLDYHNMIRNLTAHEVGHTLGIPHASSNCNDEKILSWNYDGLPICGRAIMNPLIDYKLNGITGTDHEAFQNRPPGGVLGASEAIMATPDGKVFVNELQ